MISHATSTYTSAGRRHRRNREIAKSTIALSYCTFVSCVLLIVLHTLICENAEAPEFWQRLEFGLQSCTANSGRIGSMTDATTQLRSSATARGKAAAAKAESESKQQAETKRSGAADAKSVEGLDAASASSAKEQQLGDLVTLSIGGTKYALQSSNGLLKLTVHLAGSRQRWAR